MLARWLRRAGYVAGILGTLSACTARNAPIQASGQSEPAPMPGGAPRAPSFGQGTELAPEDEGPVLPWRQRSDKVPPPEIESSPALAAPSDDGVDSNVHAVANPGTPPTGARARLDAPPEAPPTGSNGLVRGVYQLQAQVYGLYLLLEDPRVKAQLLSRIDAAEQTGTQLVVACQDAPGCAASVEAIADSLATLRASAVQHDEPAMKQVLSELAERLARLRATLPP